MIGVIIALLSGALMSIQGVFNTGATKQTSMWIMAAFVQITAFLVCVIAWFVTGRESSISDIFAVQPKYLLLGGAIGAFITYTVVESINKLGPARSAMLIVSAQLLVSYLIEMFGLFGMEKQPFELRKLIGFLIIVIGVVIFKFK